MSYYTLHQNVQEVLTYLGFTEVETDETTEGLLTSTWTAPRFGLEHMQISMKDRGVQVTIQKHRRALIGQGWELIAPDYETVMTWQLRIIKVTA